MPKSDSEYRIALYECQISHDRHIVKGKALNKEYYQRTLSDKLLESIKEDLQEMSRLCGLQYPVLVTSWRLYLKHSLPKCNPDKDELKGKNLSEVRKAFGLSPKREKIPGTETYRVVIDERGNTFKVDPSKNAIWTEPV